MISRAVLFLTAVLAVACSSGPPQSPEVFREGPKTLPTVPDLHGQNVGNGGDFIQALFEQGRVHAASAVRSALLREYAAPLRSYLQSDEELTELLGNRDEVLSNINLSQHHWSDEIPPGQCPSHTCACTPAQKSGEPAVREVYFSFRRCDSHQRPAAVGQLLLHEALHRIKFVGDSEDKADRLANAVFQVFRAGHADVPRWYKMPPRLLPDKSTITRLLPAWTGSQLLLVNYPPTSAQIYQPIRNKWTVRTLAPDHGKFTGFGLSADSVFSAWVGERFVVLANDRNGNGRGSIYDLRTGSSNDIEGAGAPPPRLCTRRILSASDRLFVWGCQDDRVRVLDPVANRWSALPPNPLLKLDSDAAALWTGDRMVLWGGCRVPLADGTCAELSPSGVIYSPRTGDLQRISVGSVVARRDPLAAWSPMGLILYGGYDLHPAFLSSGGIYDPTNARWKSIPNARGPHPRKLFFGDGRLDSVWTGTEMMVVGDENVRFYNPFENAWRVFDSVLQPPLPENRGLTWTGTELIVTGNAPDSDYVFIP